MIQKEPNEDHYPFRNVLGILLLAMVIPSLFEFNDGLFSQIFYTLILFTSLYTVSKTKMHLVIGLSLAVPSLVANWWYFFDENGASGFKHVFAALFFLWMILLVSRSIAASSKITSDTIFGAMAVFFLLGFMWAQLYGLVASMDPMAFSHTAALFEGGQLEVLRSLSFNYYSFVTLTTVGYGDITPLTPSARMLSILEGICGQFYMAVVVGSLIGLKLAQAKSVTPPEAP